MYSNSVEQYELFLFLLEHKVGIDKLPCRFHVIPRIAINGKIDELVWGFAVTIHMSAEEQLRSVNEPMNNKKNIRNLEKFQVTLISVDRAKTLRVLRRIPLTIDAQESPIAQDVYPFSLIISPALNAAD